MRTRPAQSAVRTVAKPTTVGGRTFQVRQMNPAEMAGPGLPPITTAAEGAIPQLRPQSRFKSRWCVLIHRQPGLRPCTPKTSPRPRLTYGGVAGLVMRIHVLAGASRGQGATPRLFTRRRDKRQHTRLLLDSTSRMRATLLDLRQAPISKAITLLCL
jgi:hypothetical protein